MHPRALRSSRGELSAPEHLTGRPGPAELTLRLHSMPRRTLGRVVLLATCLTTLASCATPGRGGLDVSRAPGADASADQLLQVPRQFVRHGRMEVEVEHLPTAQARVESSLSALGGRIEHLESAEDERAEYTLRVPTDHLDVLMDSVAALGEVEVRTVGAVDVTEHVIDAEARIEALRASRDRLRQLLERAGTVQDVIAVERELARVQGELESFEGRLNALRGQTAFAELSVRLARRRVLGPLGLLLYGVGTVVEKLFVWR